MGKSVVDTILHVGDEIVLATVQEATLIRVELNRTIGRLSRLAFTPHNVGGAAIPVYVDLIMARDRLYDGHPIYILEMDFERLQALV